jgi:two-component sensor histidine kinase
MLKQLASYGYALGMFALAVIARLLIDFVVPGQLPFITFFPAVFLAGYYLGLGPGVLVLVLSTLVGALWIEPIGPHPISLYVTSGFLFFVIAAVILFLVDALATAHRKLRWHDGRLEMINRELKHRIKNLFAIADSVCQQTINAGGSTKEMSKAVSGRIRAISSAQELLSSDATEGAELTELVQKLVSNLAPSPSRIRIEGQPLRLPGEATTPFALILHELATNALKYGAWTKDDGWIHITWSVSKLLQFRWREHDGPTLAPPVREGLGRKLIKSSLPGARVEHSFKSDGLQCDIDLPLPESP